MMTFIYFAARGALALALGLAAMPLLARASAATRRLALVLATLSVVALPIASALLPPLHLASTPAPAALDRTALAAASSPDPIARASAVAAPAAAPPASTVAATDEGLHVSIVDAIFALWLLGAAAVIARLGVGMVRVHRMVRGAQFLETQPAAEIRASAAIDTPAVVGLFRAVILLPREAATWSAERRRVVLLHELAHVARRDCLVNALAQIAVALHWFNPLAWVAARRLRVEQELAADDLVLRAGAQPSSYAQHLLDLAGVWSDVPTGALAMAERSQISLRIRALLVADRSRGELRRAPRALAVGLALSTAAVVACATSEPAPPAAAASPVAATVTRTQGASLAAIAPADLTLDPALQAIAEQETDRLVGEWHPRAAVVVVIDPQTGEVRAMTSRSADPTVDVAAQRAYVPGSTMKTFLVAAALDAAAIAPTQRFDVRAYGTIHDVVPNTELDVTQILAVSSNIGAAKIFDALGPARYGAKLASFHFGETAALPLPGVASGSVPAPVTAEAAIGEGLTATPLQVAAAFAAVANDGIYHAPTLVHRGAPAGERVLREATARTAMTLLESVVDGDTGTGKAARIDGVRVAGKTGTAELEPGKQDGVYYASFVGAAPLDHPRYVVLVGAEAPANRGSGGQVAAPAFARIMIRALAR